MLVDEGGVGFAGAADRMDVLKNVEEIVASQGGGTLDLTNSTQNLQVTFSRGFDATKDINATLDRETRRIELTDLDTSAPISRNYLEYRDAGKDATVTQPTAIWANIEGSDKNETVIFTDAESTGLDREINLRGGLNTVKYNELTRSINTEISVQEWVDNTNKAATTNTTGVITAVTTFTDGAGAALPGGKEHTVTSYTADNQIAAGTLRMAASQDAEDAVSFVGDTLEKLFILGQVISGSDVLTAKLGSGDAQNTLELTGYELLIDSKSDDVYQVANLSVVQLGSLQLVDNGIADHDALAVGNDFVGAAINAIPQGKDTINLAIINANLFNLPFDFDVLDITNVTKTNLNLIGTIDGDDELVVGALGNIASVTGFEALVLTDKSTDKGTSLTLNLDDAAVFAGATKLFTYTGNILSAGGLVFNTGDQQSYIDPVATGLTISVTDAGGVGAAVWGGAGVDTITGGAGGDSIRGGGGNDNLNGGVGTEVRQIEVLGFLDGTATYVGVDIDGFAVNVPVGGLGQLSSTAGSQQIAAALVQAVNANLAAINAWLVGSATNPGTVLVSASVTNGTLLNFTFAGGVDVDNGDTIAVTTDDGGAAAIPFTASAETVVAEGGNGGADTYVFEATKAENGTDTISGIDNSDQFDFSAYFDGAYLFTTTGYNFGASVPTFGGVGYGGSYVVVGFNKATLSAADFAGIAGVHEDMSSVYITTADADGAFGGADTTNEGWKAYYVHDTNPAAGVTIAVELIANLNQLSEFWFDNSDFIG